eukprot:6186661-Pleurochrysis_carterae.AAC.1
MDDETTCMRCVRTWTKYEILGLKLMKSSLRAASLKLQATPRCIHSPPTATAASAAARVTAAIEPKPSPTRSSSAHVKGKSATGCGSRACTLSPRRRRYPKAYSQRRTEQTRGLPAAHSRPFVIAYSCATEAARRRGRCGARQSGAPCSRCRWRRRACRAAS